MTHIPRRGTPVEDPGVESIRMFSSTMKLRNMLSPTNRRYTYTLETVIIPHLLQARTQVFGFDLSLSFEIEKGFY